MEYDGSTMQPGEGQTVGNPDTGAVFIRNDVNDEGTTFQLNIYDCWFECNYGYTVYSEPGQRSTLSLINSLFHTWGTASYFFLGVSLSTDVDNNSHNSVYEVCKVYIQGCSSSYPSSAIPKLPNIQVQSQYCVFVGNSFESYQVNVCNPIDPSDNTVYFTKIAMK